MNLKEFIPNSHTIQACATEGNMLLWQFGEMRLNIYRSHAARAG